MSNPLHKLLLLSLFALCLQSCDSGNSDPDPKPVDPITPIDPWTELLDSSLSKWDKFIGVPHYSVNLPEYPEGDGMNGTPIGLNNDPLQVFSVVFEDGKPVLHVSGEIYGGLSTKDEYQNYHLKMEFKWGNKKYEPRLNQKRDSGILYHATGDQGKFWNVWMSSQEMQVQEGDIGDYYALAGVGADIRAVNKFADGEQAWIYSPDSASLFFSDKNGISGRCRRGSNHEKSHGEWNTLELICFGTKSIHIVNGKVVMVIENSLKWLDSGSTEPLEKGKVQLQSEGAEAYYRNIRIKEITTIPEEFL